MILSWRASLIQTWRKSSIRSMFWDPPISQLQRESGWVDDWSWGRRALDDASRCVLISLFVFLVQYHSEPDGQHLLKGKGVSPFRGMLVFGAWWETLPTLCWCVSVKVKMKGKIHKEAQGLAIQQQNCVSDKLDALKCMHVDQAIDGSKDEPKNTNNNWECRISNIN